MGLYDFTFYDLIGRNAATFGDREAWFEVDNGQRLTFSQYKEKVDSLACGLQNAGVRKGDRIGAVGKNSLEYFLLYGAAAALGAIMLPINWRLSADEVGYNLNDCEPKLVFADKEFEQNINGLKDNLPTVEQYFNLGPEGGTFSDFNGLLGQGSDFDRPEVATDDGFVIIHTAAVAGRPRGALLSHGNVLCADMHFGYFFNLTPKDAHLNILPLFHVGGLFMVTSSFHGGVVNVNMSKFDATIAVEMIEEKKISMMFTFAPILSSVLEAHEKTGKDISSLRISAGLDTPDTIEKYQEITGGTFYCMYGQTETSCVATFGAYNDRPGSAGRTLPLAEVRLVDDYDRPVPVGQVGEITMRGPMVFKGYWNLSEDNAYTFREGWHHTGDQGRFDEDGFLWYAGRKAEKELIKPGGENVYPAEVEKVVLEHPAVEKTVVFGVPDPKWKEGIKAVCQLKEGATLLAQDLIDFVGGKIARYKKPQYVEFVTALPLLEDGTIDRAKAKELYGEEG
ncbi:MAG: AMP-binding protein [Deltaproteobacteria bacterium]|nr:AMP-binding protein [Deltaproteobacteria bacterium]